MTSVLRIARDFEMKGKKKRGRLKIWKQVEEETEKTCLKKEDALNRAKWRQSANNCGRNGINPAISAKGKCWIKNCTTTTTTQNCVIV